MKKLLVLWTMPLAMTLTTGCGNDDEIAIDPASATIKEISRNVKRRTKRLASIFSQEFEN